MKLSDRDTPLMPLPVVPVITDPAEIEQIELEIEAEFAEEMSAISLDFAEALPESLSPEQMDKVSVATLRYLIQAGEGGYKDNPDSIEDEDGNPPSADNNWLWDDEAQEFRGRFIDTRPQGDRVFSFTIAKVGNGWRRNFSPLKDAVEAEQ